MFNNFDDLVGFIARWAKVGERKLDNGVRLICPVPYVGPQAWLHSLFAPLTKDQIDKLECNCKQNLPSDFKEFLTRANGVSLFVGEKSISIWGQRFSYVRTGDEARQPFDIVDLNEQPNRPANSPDQVLFFASVESGDSWCFFERQGSGYRIGKTSRQEFSPNHYWASFWVWLSDEVNEVASGYQLDGTIKSL